MPTIDQLMGIAAHVERLIRVLQIQQNNGYVEPLQGVFQTLTAQQQTTIATAISNELTNLKNYVAGLS